MSQSSTNRSHRLSSPTDGDNCAQPRRHRHLLTCTLPDLYQRRRIAHELLTSRCQPRTDLVAHEQLSAEQFFERPHPHAHRRLREVQAFRGTYEISARDNLEEGACQRLISMICRRSPAALDLVDIGFKGQSNSFHYSVELAEHEPWGQCPISPGDPSHDGCRTDILSHPGLETTSVDGSGCLPQGISALAARSRGLLRRAGDATRLAELAKRTAIVSLLDELRRRGPLTLIYGARYTMPNNAIVLREVLEEASREAS
jgi:hypothetical protein